MWFVSIIAIVIGFAQYEMHAIKTKLVVLDFSKTHYVSQIPLAGLTWPGGVEGQSDMYVELLLPNEVSYKGHVSLLAFTRKGDLVNSVSLNLDDGTVDEVYSQAIDFAKAWNLSTKRLEDWHAKAKRVGVRTEDFPTDAKNDVEPAIDLEIHYSFDDSKPVFVSLEFAW